MSSGNPQSGLASRISAKCLSPLDKYPKCSLLSTIGTPNLFSGSLSSGVSSQEMMACLRITIVFKNVKFINDLLE